MTPKPPELVVPSNGVRQHLHSGSGDLGVPGGCSDRRGAQPDDPDDGWHIGGFDQLDAELTALVDQATGQRRDGMIGARRKLTFRLGPDGCSRHPSGPT